MKKRWIDACLEFSRIPADFYSGARKILRTRSIHFSDLKDDISLDDAGYTSAKLAHLKRNYLHAESIEVAQQLWKRRVEQDKYGSVGFTCYNHFIKNNPDKKAKRASVMGPCIQAVILTYLPSGDTSIDVFYRTTELFKKFPADLVFLRETINSNFKLDLQNFSCHFANVTLHPMYFVTIVPHISDPIAVLETIKKRDIYFYNWTIKWTARYICSEFHRGIAKFSQALRVQKDAYERIDKKQLIVLRKYVKANHPGYRNKYEDENADSDDS